MRHDLDADECEEAAAHGREPETFLPLHDGEEKRQQRDEREQDLAESRVQLDERVVRERERRPELQPAVERGAGSARPRGKRNRSAATTPKKRSAASRKRSPAPHSGSSSRFE